MPDPTKTLPATRARLKINPVLTTVLAMLWLTFTHAQPDPQLTGTWRGSLIAAQMDPLEVVLHIQFSPTGSTAGYSATLDIPAQFRSGLPVASISLNGNNLLVSMPALDAEFYGSFVFDEQGSHVVALNGDWSQSGEYVPLRLQRSN
jgi:hypothetical protein